MVFRNTNGTEISFIDKVDESFYESYEKVFIPTPPPENIKKNNSKNGKTVRIKHSLFFPDFIF